MLVRDLFNLDCFRNAQLIAGFEYLDKEIKNIECLRFNEAILEKFNNYAIVIDFESEEFLGNSNIEKFLIQLLEKEISVICIKLKDKIIQDKLVKIFNDKKIALIKLNYNSDINNIIESVLSYDLNQRINTFNEKENLYRKFMRLIMIGATSEVLVDLLSDYVNRDILLLDYYYNIISSSNSNIQVSLKDENDLNPQNIQIYKNNKILDDNKYLIHKIFSKNTIFGYIVIINTDTLSKHMLTIIDQFSLMFAIFFYKNDIVLERERRSQQNVIRDIFDGKINSERELIQLENDINWTMKFPQFLYIINSKDINSQEEIVNNLEKKYRNKCYYIRFFDYSKSIVLFIANEYLEDINIQIDEFISKNLIKSIGKSYKINSFLDYKKAYDQSIIAIELGTKLNKQKIIFNYNDYYIYKLISEVKNEQSLKTIVDEKIGILLKDNDGEYLLETLIYLINNNFNRTKTAKSLYIHYNTLRYRIERLHNLGFLSEQGVTNLEVVIAYYIYKWLKR